MQKKMLFLLMLHCVYSSTAQNLYGKIETGSKVVFSTYFDADTSSIADLFSTNTSLTNSFGVEVEYISKKRKIGIGIGLAHATYATVANIQSNVYSALVDSRIKKIRRYYTQLEYPIRISFPIIQKGEFIKIDDLSTKTEQFVKKVKLRGSVGLIGERLIDFWDYSPQDYGSVTLNATRQLDYEYRPRSATVFWGGALELGLNLEVETSRRVSFVLSPRAVWGISPMVSYYFPYIITATDTATETHGEGQVFAKGDNFSLNVAFKYQLR
jgi:hypothetical protein